MYILIVASILCALILAKFIDSWSNQNPNLGPVSNVVVLEPPDMQGTPPPGGFTTFPLTNLQYHRYIYWDAPPNTTEFNVQYAGPDIGITDTIVSYKGNAAFFEFNFNSNGNEIPTFAVRAINNTSVSDPVIGISQTTACFPAGSKVKTNQFDAFIENIKVGDFVLGAFGEMNQVLGLQRVYVGDNILFQINDEHITTDHHPHVTPLKTFLVCPEGKKLTKHLYGSEYEIFNGHTNVFKNLEGLDKSRIEEMNIGSELKTFGGSKVIKSIRIVQMEPKDILYNLVVSGSHTYHVDGYAVTGWPNENDFNYDDWIPK